MLLATVLLDFIERRRSNSIISGDSIIHFVATGRQSELFFTLSDFVLFCFVFLILSHSNDRRSESNFI